MTVVARTIAQLRAAVAELPGAVGLVPTMGALHDGHGQLVSLAAGENTSVVVSIFVNPLQFTDLGDCDDYRHYPRDLDKDVAFLESLGVDVVFAPAVEEMYPDGLPQVWVRAGEMGERLEGASRPGHFDGVTTVVAKLFHLVRPDRAYFGEKDADLNFDLQIRPVPIIRGADGLAESSRNQHLTPQAREQALVLPRTLSALRERAAAGQPLDVEGARATLSAAAGVELDHLEVVDAATLLPVDEVGAGALAVAAIHVGGTRLIDNVRLLPPSA